ncbi:5-hydroxytryptamine receptor 3A-like [Sinocyclocheilus rhinocerous]|uniref:5-hydroxytryptamine receptor 3A-like n=1 Tax=Sinocyclocheilus rhinocerous TaxID=307959 RepID=UPI0007B9E5C1|nr:PREDICTED: 5-hydroxytryptamine receptor 3A-like [Sinocyclocheilus rhinocerous]
MEKNGVFPKRVCSKQDVLEYLNLTRDYEKFTTCRPALDWPHPTVVYYDIDLYGILSMSWKNERISWDPKDFCGIKSVILPKEMLWKPDLYVYETAEKEDGPLNPYLYITHDGNVRMEDDHKIVSTCTMNVHKFPFDTQTCHITVSSINYSDRVEKLCFKVTVLLGISVLLLILNDILPSKSHRCPLIAVYVIVIFSFMLLSLLETVLVIYLINMNSEQDDKGVQRPEDHNSDTDNRKRNSNDHICYSGVETPLESLMLKEIYSKEKMNDVQLLQLTKQTLVPETLKAKTAQIYWLGMAKRINRVFFVVYLISVFLFLVFIFREWKVE